MGEEDLKGKKGEGRLQLSSDTLRRCIAHAVVINMSHPAYKSVAYLQGPSANLKCQLNVQQQINCNAQTICSNLPMCIQISRKRKRQSESRTGKWQELTVKCKLNGES